MPPLQFQPLSSRPTPGFWSALNNLKLDRLKLDDAQQPIVGWLEEAKEVVDREASGSAGEGSRTVGVDGALSVGGAAFGEGSEKPPVGAMRVHGVFKNFNTIEEFRSVEGKKALFDDLVDKILASFTSDQPMCNPFLLVTFADLKKYVYQYWFAFPALVSKPAWEVDEPGLEPVDDEYAERLRQLEYELEDSEDISGAFLVHGATGQESAVRLGQARSLLRGGNARGITLVFHDPSSLPQNPGWPLRNLLYYLSTLGISQINVVCLRAGSASRRLTVRCSPATSEASNQSKPSAVGWERNKSGKLASRVADLGPMMDPARLADQAVDLNLKLMRWRILPNLELDRIAHTKCLLLGAGTLGCYVARALMGWGVRHITFVDSARVSYSNPVRQPLFDFSDCLDGGRPKAQCAAEKLGKIFPGVHATAHDFMIPMPGHPVSASAESIESTKRDVWRLETLIEEHDAVFLLMDSRESRWLPTVISASLGKVVINAALGFDSYLVMRHGAGPDQAKGKRLGCYYCNDVVAPTDSLSDRTLDQMCTVTRPGIAPIASASAVELLVSLLQHPLGIDAPAETATSVEDADSSDVSCLGAVPHQLRGQLSSWRTNLVEGEAYDKCTGCSKVVIDAYRSEGLDMLLRVFNEADYLEKLTGLDELHKESEALLEDVEWDEGSEASL